MPSESSAEPRSTIVLHAAIEYLPGRLHHSGASRPAPFYSALVTYSP